jgi:glucose/arabinose dehydrogenase
MTHRSRAFAQLNPRAMGASPAIGGLAGLLLVAVLLAGCGNAPPLAPAAEPRVVAQPVSTRHATRHGEVLVTELVTGLEHPWGLAFLPDGSMLVSERPGRLRRISPRGGVSAPLDGLPRIFVAGQAGLLDIALSPDFVDDRLVYLSYAEPNLRGNLAGTAVARGRLEGDALVDVEVIYRQQPRRSAGTHVGSRLVFDDGGHLFVTQGDNRVAAEMAQQLDVLPGKVVRIRADGAIPPDNPFVGDDDARPEIWSYGHRNVQGAALHPVTRQLWISEHGPMGGDEINIVLAGANHGWPRVSHGRDYDGRPVPGSIGRSAPGMTPPHRAWAVSPGVSGMAFYTGGLFPAWRGDLLVAALASGELIRLDLDGSRIVGEERLLGERGQRLRDVRLGPDGAIYLLTDAADGSLLRLQPAAAAR